MRFTALQLPVSLDPDECEKFQGRLTRVGRSGQALVNELTVHLSSNPV